MYYLNKVDKLWGRERWLINNELYCAKYLDLTSGGMSSLHYHKVKDECFYIEEGACCVVVYSSVENEPLDRSSETIHYMRGGDSVRIRPWTPHRFFCYPKDANMGLGCKILEVSTTHDDNDVVRLEESRRIDVEERK